jgi:hypothetical protein
MEILTLHSSPPHPKLHVNKKHIYIYIYAIHMYTYICLSLYIYIILYVWHVCVLCGMSIYMYICIYLCIYIYHTIWSWRHLATCCPMSCMEEARARHMFPNTASQKRPGGEAGPTTHVKDPGMKRSLPLCSCFGDNDLTRASSPVRCGIYIYIYKSLRFYVDAKLNAPLHRQFLAAYCCSSESHHHFLMYTAEPPHAWDYAGHGCT